MGVPAVVHGVVGLVGGRGLPAGRFGLPAHAEVPKLPHYLGV
jgi:hypothetical protein